MSDKGSEKIQRMKKLMTAALLELQDTNVLNAHAITDDGDHLMLVAVRGNNVPKMQELYGIMQEWLKTTDATEMQREGWRRGDGTLYKMERKS